MEPEARRAQILDEAVRVILSGGLSALNIEQLGRGLGISKSLIYNYFPNREDLIAAILQHEVDDLRRRGMTEALQVDSFEGLIRATTRVYLEQVRDGGGITEVLMADPQVAASMETDARRERAKTIRYFVGQVRETYGLTPELAAQAVDLLMAITGQAGRQLADGHISLQGAEDLCTTLILGGLEALARR